MNGRDWNWPLKAGGLWIEEAVMAGATVYLCSLMSWFIGFSDSDCLILWNFNLKFFANLFYISFCAVITDTPRIPMENKKKNYRISWYGVWGHMNIIITIIINIITNVSSYHSKTKCKTNKKYCEFIQTLCFQPN